MKKQVEVVHAWCGGGRFCELNLHVQLTAPIVQNNPRANCPNCLEAFKSRGSYLEGLDRSIGHRSNT